MKTFLFDDQGDAWDATSRKLANALCASISGGELANYAIRNLGYIAVSDRNGSIGVRLRPAVVSQMAFSALFYWLHDRPIERILLSFLDSEWTHELMASREEAIKRLMTRVTFNADDRDGDFLRRTRPLHALPSASPLRALLRFWSESGGKYDRERLSPVLDEALDQRFVLVEGAGDSSSLYFKEVGSGLTTLADFWVSHATHLRVEDQPDYAYGKWVSTIYREVLASGKPSFEEIDAIINWPEDPYRKSYRYRRLVVPFSGKSNSTVLLGASLIDPQINLRAKPC